MANNKTRLTAAKVKGLVAQGAAGRHGDGGAGGHGLCLFISPKGAARWIQRLRVPHPGEKYGKVKDFPLGRLAEVSLAEAREKAAANHRAVKTGGRPERQAKPGGMPTFAEAMEAAIALRRPKWRSGSSEAQWRATLGTYAAPLMGLPIDQIKGKDVMDCLQPIWFEKSETASRLKDRISIIMNWAVANEHREFNPVPAIAFAMPKHTGTRKHFPALPHAEVADAIAKVRESNSFAATKLAFEFLVLTAGRSGEIRGAVWGEIDLEAAIWTIPAGRMKANKQHRVPLSPRALEVLREARRLHDGELVFPSPRTGKPLSNVALGNLLRKLGIAAAPHGFRSSFRNWAAELSGASREAGVLSLAHSIGDQVEQAYLRSDLIDQRRKLMADWADYLAA